MFQITSEDQFLSFALGEFHRQVKENPVYAAFVHYLGIREATVKHLTEIPFLPVELFKHHRIYASRKAPAVTFFSSGTTGMERSRHEIADPELYHTSLLTTFRQFYGDPSSYCIMALVPSREEAPHSSLAYMIDYLIRSGNQADSGFYLHDQQRLQALLQSWHPPQTGYPIKKPEPRILLIGLTYALLDFAERFPVSLPDAIIMETGGMKGHRREMIREEVHDKLKRAFSVTAIHSEYGMSELLSQAYSQEGNRFCTPPWMKVLIRDTYDPLGWVDTGRTGGISIIDLANRYSCPFIATQDLGKRYADGSFAVLGRFDSSELRGCNLMMV